MCCNGSFILFTCPQLRESVARTRFRVLRHQDGAEFLLHFLLTHQMTRQEWVRRDCLDSRQATRFLFFCNVFCVVLFDRLARAFCVVCLLAHLVRDDLNGFRQTASDPVGFIVRRVSTDFIFTELDVIPMDFH